MSFVNENKDMSWRLRRGAAFFASPGRCTSTCWSRWSCLDGIKSGWWVWVLGHDEI